MVAQIHRRSQFAAMGTLKPKVSVALLRDGTKSTQANNRQLHR
jgi:hypothetical protein